VWSGTHAQAPLGFPKRGEGAAGKFSYRITLKSFLPTMLEVNCECFIFAIFPFLNLDIFLEIRWKGADALQLQTCLPYGALNERTLKAFPKRSGITASSIAFRRTERVGNRKWAQ
jgi:hypothetical protein